MVRAGLKFILFLLLFYVPIKISDLFIPFHYGIEEFPSKVEFLEANQEEFNNYFFGNSRIFRQVDPTQFDAQSCKEVKSFNLAMAAMFNPEVYYLYENFLESGLLKPGYAFVELQQINDLDNYVIHSYRSKYYLNHKYYNFAQSVIEENDLYNGEQMKKDYRHTYIEKVLNIGLVYQKLRNLVGLNEKNPDILGPNKDGYQSLEFELSNNDQHNLKARKARFQRERAIITPRKLRKFKRDKQRIKRKEKKKRLPENKTHLSLLNDLIDKSAEKGIHLIFLVSQNQIYLEEVYSVYQQLDAEHRIEVSEKSKYPWLYDINNYFDRLHLNDSGSEQFTNAIAVEFNTIMDCE